MVDITDQSKFCICCITIVTLKTYARSLQFVLIASPPHIWYPSFFWVSHSVDVLEYRQFECRNFIVLHISFSARHTLWVIYKVCRLFIPIRWFGILMKVLAVLFFITWRSYESTNELRQASSKGNGRSILESGTDNLDAYWKA